MPRSRKSSESQAPAHKIQLQPPLMARNGHTLQVLETCRVSDPTKQDERSPDEQGGLTEEWLRSSTDSPFEVTRLTGSGSGECLECDEYLQLLDLIATRQFDVVLTEDLGRICRRIHAHLVCEHCVDHGTRLISPFVDRRGESGLRTRRRGDPRDVRALQRDGGSHVACQRDRRLGLHRPGSATRTAR